MKKKDKSKSIEAIEIGKLEDAVREKTEIVHDSAEELKSSEKNTEVKEEKIKAVFATERVITEAVGTAKELYDKSRYGEIVSNKIHYSLHEALYLFERGKMDIYDGKKLLGLDNFVKKARKVEPTFWVRYSVFRDLRNRGYIVKTALKFGADFRVYERGIKPGEDHAKWIVYPVHEGGSMTWYEFASKNRVAHSTRKRLLLGIVDDEGSVTYYECKWVRP